MMRTLLGDFLVAAAAAKDVVDINIAAGLAVEALSSLSQGEVIEVLPEAFVEKRRLIFAELALLRDQGQVLLEGVEPGPTKTCLESIVETLDTMVRMMLYERGPAGPAF